MLYPESYYDGNWRNQKTRKKMRHLGPLRRFSFRDNWMKELGKTKDPPAPDLHRCKNDACPTEQDSSATKTRKPWKTAKVLKNFNHSVGTSGRHGRPASQFQESLIENWGLARHDGWKYAKVVAEEFFTTLWYYPCCGKVASMFISALIELP